MAMKGREIKNWCICKNVDRSSNCQIKNSKVSHLPTDALFITLGKV
jgi:hypothetical protein